MQRAPMLCMNFVLPPPNQKAFYSRKRSWPCSLFTRSYNSLRRSQSNYFLTLRACRTKFSITPSKASFSLTSPSRRFSQYSNTSLVRVVKSFSSLTCACNSSSVKPSSFSSVVAHSRFTDVRSNSGGGGGPFGFLDRGCRSLLAVVLDCVESSEAVESFPPAWAFNLARDPRFGLSPSDFLVDGSRFMSGRTSFFCFDGGRISSRSTGTPRLTRKRRRMRDCVQFGG